MQKPSEMIRLHISGKGGGFELDDLMTRRTGGIYDQIVQRLIDIHQRFRTAEYRIGTSNPGSFDELQDLAAELEQQGL